MLYTLPLASDLRHRVESVTFLADGHTLAVTFDADETVVDTFTWNFTSDQIITMEEPNNFLYVTNAAASPDGRFVIGYGKASLIHFWNADDGRVALRLNRYAAALAFSPNGHYLATASSYVAEIWDMDAILP